MRKEGIGYLPQFDEVVGSMRELLEFFQEERGIIEFSRFVELHFEGKNRSESTIRLLQNTLSNYGLIRETQDYVYVITNLGQQWLRNGSPEELIKIIHDHVSYMGEILLELEEQKLSREEIQNRALQFYDIQFNNTDITRRLQVFKGVGMVAMNRKKIYSLTQKGADFLHNITLEPKKMICEVDNERKEEQENFVNSFTEKIFEKLNEDAIIKKLYEKILSYLRNIRSFSEVASYKKIQYKTSKGLKVIKPDVLIYFTNKEQMKLQLVIEIITEETRNSDFLEKLFDYKKIGVEECWMVDYVSGNVMIYDWKNGLFSTNKLSATIESNNFSLLKMDFSRLEEEKSDVIVLDGIYE